MDNNTKEFLGENSNDNQNKSNNIVMTGASAILAGMDGWLNRSISNLEYIPNSLWKSLARHTFKPAGIVIDINSIMTAEGEKERFKAYYGVFLSNFGAIGGGLIGGAMGGIVGAAGGSALGNLGGNQLAEFSSDFVYDFIQAIQSIGTTNPRLTLADIKLVEALFDQYTQKDSTQSNKQDRISCLQPTPNLANKDISTSFKDTISSKVTQTPKEETLNLKN